MKIFLLYDRSKRIGLESAVAHARNKDWLSAPVADTFGPSAALTKIVTESLPLLLQINDLEQVLSNDKDVVFVVFGGQRTSEAMHFWARVYGAKVVFIQNSWEWADNVDSSAKFGLSSYADTLTALLGKYQHQKMLILPGKASTLKSVLAENREVFVGENLAQITNHFGRDEQALAIVPEHLLLNQDEEDDFMVVSNLDLVSRLSKRLNLVERLISRITGNTLREAMSMSRDDSLYATRVADIVFGLVQPLYDAHPDQRPSLEDEYLNVPGRVEFTTRYRNGGFVFDLSGRAVREMDKVRQEVRTLHEAGAVM